ncbi:MAG: hypothetical protein HUJ26_11580 [Planctomycetaceae bacterium]|nr:hypothetical protein [Planctomycetaceae bacterium]
MIIVQKIKTEWTKASRGGSGASARNATPDAMRLPVIAAPHPGFLFHDIRFLESENFQSVPSTRESDAKPLIRIEPLWVRVTKETVAARFVWSWHHCGAPKRKSHDLFRLSIGEWGRFTCNGRFGAESSTGREWVYHKTVFNIGFILEPDENLFLDKKPVTTDAELVFLK